VFRDVDGDGIADQQQQLVSGLTTEMVETRGGDHTTNCVRIGIDGWLYIGDGDYGVPGAIGVDGSQVTLRGGGILRVRPDGTELELFASGLRNPFDIAIDPYLNLFTRDNTNDGGGWDTRVSQLHASAEYGYPRLFANFSDEIMPTLGTFGGGGGTGGLYVEDPAWPAALNPALLTGDWGRSAIFHHSLLADGPTFTIDQNSFVSVPRATGMDMDVQGNLYLASWWSGEASVYVGPHVGFVARVAPDAAAAREFPDLQASSVAQLIDLLRVPQAAIRFHAQGQLIQRGPNDATRLALQATIVDPSFPLAGRVAALFALKQIDGLDAHPFLVAQLADASLREFAIRALTDRRTQLAGLRAEVFQPYLHDPDPRVVAQAVIALGRLGDSQAAAWLLPLGELPTTQRPDPAQPNADLVIPHLAVQSLVRLAAVDACLQALDGASWRTGLRALRQMPDSVAVRGLIQKLGDERDLERRTEILATLIRLYQQESPYDGSWWGIRPDTTGPFYDPMTWHESESIERVVRRSLETADSQTRDRVLTELRRHQVPWEGLADLDSVDLSSESTPIVIQAVDPNKPRQIGNLTDAETLRQTLAQIPTADPIAGRHIYQTRSCANCHTSLPGQQPVGPHLADIGQRYKPEELIESILKPSEKIAQGYETQVLLLTNGELVTGFVISENGRQIWLRDSQGQTHKIARDDIEERGRQPISAMPSGLVGNLEPEDLANLIAYLRSL
jgi:putative heme-binding domain-containing protein